METLNVDFAIIGSGPAGQKGAIQAAKLGAKVVVIEKDPYPGGVSINRGTIPSKTMREAIIELTDFYKRNFKNAEQCLNKVTIKDLYYNLNKVLIQERNLINRQFTKNQINFIQGWASFSSPYELNVSNNDGTQTYTINTKFIMIACGSQPRRPVDVPFDSQVILDSNCLLSIDDVPKTMLVLGGGIIGAEYASFFSALGTQVTVVDKKSTMLPKLDKEISGHLQSGLSNLGLEFLGNKRVKKIINNKTHAAVDFEDGSQLKGDVLLYALGRVANVEHLNIEKIGLELNTKGDIPVNPLYQTTHSHIYAVGDVIGAPSLAATSMEQGRLAASHAFRNSAQLFPTFYPVGKKT